MKDDPLLYDLCSKAGGTSVGYHRAGFRVVGVDIEPQPHYPFEFIQMDAIEFLDRYLAGEYPRADAFAGSPPCQINTPLRYRWGREYPDLIAAMRALLIQTGKPYVIENVEGAMRKLINPLMLCGTMFNLRVIRHRLFENNFGLIFPPYTCQCRGKVGRRGHMADREYMTVTGHFSNVEKAGKAMGIDWMTQAELAQAIPPAYTEYIGRKMVAL